MTFNRLFSQWQAEHFFHAFIKDGIVNEATYENPHILFVLRDMNCRSDCDLRNFLQTKGGGWKTWNNVGRWTQALLDGTEDYPRDMNQEKRIAQLKRIAVLNLKKEGGAARADGQALSLAAETQKNLIYDEICLCKPHLIVACGLSLSQSTDSATLLKEKVFPSTSEWYSFPSEEFQRKWWYYEALINGVSVPVISFCHPQTTNLEGKRGHKALFHPLYRDMLKIRQMFIKNL